MKPSYWLNSPTSRNGRLGDTGSLEETMRKIWIDQNSGDCEKRIGLTIASWLEEARTLLKLIARICKRSLSDIGISSRPKMIPLLGNQQNKNFDLFYVLWTWVIGFLSFVRNSSYTRTISNIRDILNLDTFVNFFRSLFRASSHRMTEWANRSLYHADERRHSRRTVCDRWKTKMLSQLPTKTNCNPHRVCVQHRRQMMKWFTRPLSKTTKARFFLNF